MKNLESKSLQFVADQIAINDVQGKPTDSIAAPMHRQEHLNQDKDLTDIDWQQGLKIWGNYSKYLFKLIKMLSNCQTISINLLERMRAANHKINASRTDGSPSFWRRTWLSWEPEIQEG